MSGTTGPEHDLGITTADDEYYAACISLAVVEEADKARAIEDVRIARAALYAAIADWHRREMKTATSSCPPHYFPEAGDGHLCLKCGHHVY